jgi:hypothetical protein
VGVLAEGEVVEAGICFCLGYGRAIALQKQSSFLHCIVDIFAELLYLMAVDQPSQAIG